MKTIMLIAIFLLSVTPVLLQPISKERVVTNIVTLYQDPPVRYIDRDTILGKDTVHVMVSWQRSEHYRKFRKGLEE
jgi:hypothetical protein